MSKALLVAIQPKWLQMILNGEKKFEFRNWKVPVGTVMYFYCTKAKLYLHYRPTENCNTQYVMWDEPSEEHIVLNGKVVAKAVVKDVCGWEKENAFRVITDNGYAIRFRINDFTFIGFDEKNPSKYAIELKDVQEIEPKDVTEFVSWSKWKKSIKTWGISNIGWEEVKLTNAPQSRTWIYVGE